MRNTSRVRDSDDPADLRQRGFIPETVVPEIDQEAIPQRRSVSYDETP